MWCGVNSLSCFVRVIGTQYYHTLCARALLCVCVHAILLVVLSLECFDESSQNAREAKIHRKKIATTTRKVRRDVVAS